MYQSFVYLDVRVLLSSVPGVFIVTQEDEGKKDILSVKSELYKRNGLKAPITSAAIEPSVLRKVTTFINASGGKILNQSKLEKLTANLMEPPDDRNFTGYSVKVGEGGCLEIMFHQKSKKISFEEIRIEEDSGHLTRANGTSPHMDWTYAGCPCMRLRTKAEFELGEEAEIFLHELYTLMAYLKLVNPELGENSVRCNAYVAMAEYGDVPSYCVKLRNLNSINFVRKAINSELSREEEILSSGGELVSESRLWVQDQNTTQPWKNRSDTVVHFEAVEENIFVTLAQEGDNSIKVELPADRRRRLRSQFGLSRLRTEFICAEKDRADYFEEVIVAGGDPMTSAHWMASELTRILNMNNTSIKQCKLTPSKFAEIMNLLVQGKIHSGMAKTLIQNICKTGEKADSVIKKYKLELLSTAEEIEPYVDSVLEKNEKSVAALKSGDMAPLEFLTGEVMKESGGMALPLTVKSLIKEKLRISVIYVLTMGGAITAKKNSDGTVTAGNAEVIKSLLDEKSVSYPVQISSISEMLSEETEPQDWAKLICEIKRKMESGTASGIVVTHGTDTLPYTSALLYWLFNSSNVPVVLTSSGSLPFESDEAAKTLNLAVKTAGEKKNGVYVVYQDKILSPLNLKFINTGKDGFVNWNIKDAFGGKGYISQQFLSVNSPDDEVVSELLNEAASKFSVIKLYPGMMAKNLESMVQLESGIDSFIIELYASGTGNMRNSDFSLKNMMLLGRKRGCNFYCTSQQECKVDFSEYSTSAKVWQEGALPMGPLTTESVVGLYFAAYLLADSKEEINEFIETSLESFSS